MTLRDKPGLLPPSGEPLPPPNMKPGCADQVNDVTYVPPVLPEEGESGYWLMMPGDAPWDRTMKWVNKVEQGRPSPYMGRFHEIPGPIKFVSTRRMPRKMPDFKRGTYAHIVSQRIVDVFHAFDPDGYKLHPVEYTYRDGETPDQPFWLFYVTRIIPAIDYANSKIAYRKSEGYEPHVLRQGPVRLMPEAYDFPYFCTHWINVPIFVSDEMKQRLDSLRPKLNYVRFDYPDDPIVPF